MENWMKMGSENGGMRDGNEEFGKEIGSEVMK